MSRRVGIPCTGEQMQQAISAVTLRLSGGEWTKSRIVDEIARANGTTGEMVLTFHPTIASSDSNRWHCLPTDQTPEFAPDGT